MPRITRHKRPNIYMVSRNRLVNPNKTRFDAALDMGMSDRTLARYELEEGPPPPPEVVEAMSKLYNDPLLPARHCAEMCPIGMRIHDRVEEEAHNFPAAACGLFSIKPGFNEAVEELAKMAEDAKITPDEEELRKKIEAALKRARQKITTVQHAVAMQMLSIQ